MMIVSAGERPAQRRENAGDAAVEQPAEISGIGSGGRPRGGRSPRRPVAPDPSPGRPTIS